MQFAWALEMLSDVCHPKACRLVPHVVQCQQTLTDWKNQNTPEQSLKALTKTYYRFSKLKGTAAAHGPRAVKAAVLCEL